MYFYRKITHFMMIKGIYRLAPDPKNIQDITARSAANRAPKRMPFGRAEGQTRSKKPPRTGRLLYHIIEIQILR